MKKIAIINQRYGLEVNGGSELYSRQIAERLCKKHDVEVLTTCSLDYVTWANHYKQGIEEINGVKVRRFPTDHERTQRTFSYNQPRWIPAYPYQYTKARVNIRSSRSFR